MRVATFNALHGARPGEPPDLGALGRSCASIEADVLALQEIDVRIRRTGYRNLVDVVARTTHMYGAFGQASRVGWRGRYGNALFVRGRATDVEVVPLPRPRLGESRSCILASAHVEASGQRVSVAATHLSVDGAESPDQLDVVIAALAQRPPPRLLLGDLNLRPEVAVPILEGAGYAVADPSLSTYPAGNPHIRIDYVAAAGLVLTAVEARRLEVSDHLALVCDATGG